MTDVEETIKQEVNKSGEKNRNFIAKKLDEVVYAVQQDRARQDIKLEQMVRSAVKTEMRERRFSREVRQSVNEIDNAVVARGRPVGVKDDEYYKAEEARVLANLRRQDDNLEAVKDMARRVRSRRKVKPEKPMPLKLKEPEVVNLEDEEAD